MPLLLFLLVSPAWGAAPGISLSAEVGFSGWVTPGVWMPLRLDVASEFALDGVVEVEVPNGPAGTGAAQYRRIVQVSAGARQRLTIYVVIPDPRRPLTVLVRDVRGGLVLQQNIPLGRDQIVEGVVVALTADAAGLEFLAGAPRRIRGAYLHQEDLPDHWAGYEGVELVVLRDVDERGISGAQRQALREWIAQGGRLLVTGARLLQQRQPWLAELLPAVVSVSPAIAPGNLPGLSGPLPVAVLQPKPGAAAVPRQGMPLVISRPYGRGLVTAWAFDAFAPEVRAWPGRLALWGQVLAGPRVQPLARPNLPEVIPTTRTLPGGAQAQIIVLSILYILAVRFVLRSFAPRGGGWPALAAVVLAFSFLLYAASDAARRSAATTVQLSVLETTGAEDLARVTTYLAVLLPYGGTYAVSAPDGSLVRPLASRPLVSTAGSAVSGDAGPGVVVLVAVQMVSLPLRGQAAATADGLGLEIENRSGLTITAAGVYVNGQTQPLPEISDHLTAALPPGRWARADRNAATGDFARDARAWIASRLDDYTTPAIIGYKTLWLIGEVHDPRLSAQLQGARERRELHLLLSPVDVTGGR